jgi:hypothetical protein
MHQPSDIKRHLEHRTSILQEFITGRKAVSRNGFNCYFDATLITCRSLFALLGLTTNSRSETDLKNPTQTKLYFSDSSSFREIRDSISPLVVIRPFSSQADLDALSEKSQIIKVLVAANMCVAHFEKHLDHAVHESELEVVAKRLLHEISDRIQLPA